MSEPDTPPRRVRITDIVTLASRITGVAERDIRLSRDRKRSAPVRAMVVTEAAAHGHSYSYIGSQLGGRDHSSIGHANKRFPEYCAKSPQLAEQAKELAAALINVQPFEREKARTVKPAQRDRVNARTQVEVCDHMAALIKRQRQLGPDDGDGSRHYRTDVIRGSALLAAAINAARSA